MYVDKTQSDPIQSADRMWSHLVFFFGVRVRWVLDQTALYYVISGMLWCVQSDESRQSAASRTAQEQRIAIPFGMKSKTLIRGRT